MAKTPRPSDAGGDSDACHPLSANSELTMKSVALWQHLLAPTAAAGDILQDIGISPPIRSLMTAFGTGSEAESGGVAGGGRARRSSWMIVR